MSLKSAMKILYKETFFVETIHIVFAIITLGGQGGGEGWEMLAMANTLALI
jgi:hypothetical protein